MVNCRVGIFSHIHLTHSRCFKLQSLSISIIHVCEFNGCVARIKKMQWKCIMSILNMSLSNATDKWICIARLYALCIHCHFVSNLSIFFDIMCAFYSLTSHCTLLHIFFLHYKQFFLMNRFSANFAMHITNLTYIKINWNNQLSWVREYRKENNKHICLYPSACAHTISLTLLFHRPNDSWKFQRWLGVIECNLLL